MIRSKKDNPDIFLSRTRNRITLSNFCHLWVTHVSAVDQSFLCGCAEMEQGTNRHKFSVFQPNVDRLNQGQPKSVDVDPPCQPSTELSHFNNSVILHIIRILCVVTCLANVLRNRERVAVECANEE